MKLPKGCLDKSINGYRCPFAGIICEAYYMNELPIEELVNTRAKGCPLIEVKENDT